jgi:hypothetical protein
MRKSIGAERPRIVRRAGETKVRTGFMGGLLVYNTICV